MTTKRKQILKAMAFASCTTMDDLVTSTGFERKNLTDNVKATMKEGLCERIRDDVTGQPAYRLTPKGRAWLENDKNDSVKPQPAVGSNTGSKDTVSRVAGGDLRADLLTVGNAVSAPPKPDDLPAAACADVSPKVPATALDIAVRNHNLLMSILIALGLDGDASFACMPEMIMNMRAALDNANRINNDMANQLLEPITPSATRYIVTEDYLIVGSEEEANDVALDLAKETKSASPVVVFASNKARELHIQWRDA